MTEPLVSVSGASKKFCRRLKTSLWYGVQDLVGDVFGGRRSTFELRPEEFWAVKDVSFELRRGECLGLVGRNGAGKTTLLKLLSGLIMPDSGRITMRGRVGAIISLGAGFNPILTGRENIYINASVLGLSKAETDRKLDEIIDFAELAAFIDMPVRSYSSGMQVRLGFAVATAVEPDVLLLDEVLAVGDAPFRMKCFKRIGAILDRAAVIFVSHDAVSVSRICDVCLYLKEGSPVSLGRTEDVLTIYGDDTVAPRASRSTTMDPVVAHFECTPVDIQVQAGDVVRLRLKLKFHSAQEVGLGLIALMEGEVSVAQCDITELVGGCPREELDATVTLGPLHLRSGDYGVAVTLLNGSKKGTLVHALHVTFIRIQGRRGYGVPYQFPASLDHEEGTPR